MTVLSDNMVKIQFASEHQVIIKNEDNERIELPTRNDGNRTDDCVKCYRGGMFYWSSARIQGGLKVNDMPFDDWFATLPLKIF